MSDSILETLSDQEIAFLKSFGDSFELRKFMNKKAIRMAYLLHKKGVLEKGTSDDKSKSVIFYIDSSIRRKLY